MNELLKVNYGDERITLSARELHKGLEITERFSTWFERMNQYGFTEGIDYLGCKTFNTQAHQELQDYQITIEMGKHIAMVQRNEAGMRMRNYFIELEKKWNSPEYVMNRALEFSRKQVTKLLTQVEEMQPKADFYDEVTGSTDTVEMATVSKLLNVKNMGRTKLFQFLRDQKILQGNNQPYQTYVDRGYFRIVESKFAMPNGDIHINYKTVVFQKGVDFIRRKLKENGYS